jgi:chorismate mutase
MSQKKIDRLRTAIDELDKDLLQLFNERARRVIELGRVKQHMGKKLFDARRERDILSRMTKINPGPLSRDAIVRLYERLIDESRRLERSESYDDKTE